MSITTWPQAISIVAVCAMFSVGFWMLGKWMIKSEEEDGKVRREVFKTDDAMWKIGHCCDCEGKKEKKG